MNAERLDTGAACALFLADFLVYVLFMQIIMTYVAWCATDCATLLNELIAVLTPLLGPPPRQG
jgi:hypothetical protein